MVTQSQIQKLANVVTKEANVVKLYLFGSYVNGSADENSDIDLLVVVKDDIDKNRRRHLMASLNIKTIEENLIFPKDFKIYSLKEFNNLKEDKFSFLHEILKQAKQLYVG